MMEKTDSDLGMIGDQSTFRIPIQFFFLGITGTWFQNHDDKWRTYSIEVLNRSSRWCLIRIKLYVSMATFD